METVHISYVGEYMRRRAWSMEKMANTLKINPRALTRALKGEIIRPKTARKIAEFLSTELGHEILPGDIKGLNIE